MGKQLFIQEVRQQRVIPTIRSYLQLYTTIDVEKLSKFSETGSDQVRTQLMAIKHKSRCMTCDGNSRSNPSVINGRWGVSGDLDFFVEDGMVHVSDRKVAKQYGEGFISHIQRTEEVIAKL